MSNVSKKKLSLPTVQQPAARWAFVLAVCASLGVVVSYYWRVFYGLDARGVSAAGVTGLCVGLAVLAGAAALALRRVRDFAKKGAACILLCGVLFAFANPPMQTPDETDHYLRTYAISATPRTWTSLLRRSPARGSTRTPRQGWAPTPTPTPSSRSTPPGTR